MFDQVFASLIHGFTLLDQFTINAGMAKSQKDLLLGEPPLSKVNLDLNGNVEAACRRRPAAEYHQAPIVACLHKRNLLLVETSLR